MSQNEIQERVANLNTQLRFGRKRAALEAAYKLRTFIQLSGYQSEDALNELQRAEQIIAELERNQISSVQKWIGALVRTIQRSLNPEVDTDDESLLEQFKSKPEHPALEEEEDLEKPEPDMTPLGEAEEMTPLGGSEGESEVYGQGY